MSDIDDALDDTPTPKKRGRPPAATATAKTAKKPDKATVTQGPKPGPTPKGAKGANGGTAPAAKKGAKTVTAAKPKKVAEDVEMTQPADTVVLKAVRKIKTGTNEMASKFAHGLGVHRRVIRAQLQRLAKDKANGVKMEKTGPNWFVSNTQK